MQYTETELAQLIKSVEKEFSAHLAKAEVDAGLLAKAEDEQKEEPKEEKEEGAHEAEEAAHDAEAAAHDAEEDAHDAEEDAHEVEDESGEDHDYDEDDLEHMHKMYMSMRKGELKAHHDAIKKCLDCHMAKAEEGEHESVKGSLGAKSPASKDQKNLSDMEKAEEGEKTGEPKGSPGPKSQASEGQKNLSDMEKGEYDRANGGQMEASNPKGSPGAQSPASKDQKNLSNMEKSESEDIKTKYEDLKKNFDAVQNFLTKLAEKTSAPKGKAITDLDVLAKSGTYQVPVNVGELSKKEVTEILMKKSQDPKLEKSDRDLINAYYLTGASIDTISHLLK